MSEATPGAPVPAPAGVDYPGKTLGIVALIVAIVVGGIIGLILGIVANNQSKAAGYKNTPAKAAIIVGIIVTVLYILIFVIVGIVTAAAVSTGTVTTY